MTTRRSPGTIVRRESSTGSSKRGREIRKSARSSVRETFQAVTFALAPAVDSMERVRAPVTTCRFVTSWSRPTATADPEARKPHPVLCTMAVTARAFATARSQSRPRICSPARPPPYMSVDGALSLGFAVGDSVHPARSSAMAAQMARRAVWRLLPTERDRNRVGNLELCRGVVECAAISHLEPSTSRPHHPSR